MFCIQNFLCIFKRLACHENGKSAEATALQAFSLAAAGTLTRPFIDCSFLFMVTSIDALVGMGCGNVIGAPQVKKSFPERQTVKGKIRKRATGSSVSLVCCQLRPNQQ